MEFNIDITDFFVHGFFTTHILKSEVPFTWFYRCLIDTAALGLHMWPVLCNKHACIFVIFYKIANWSV